MLHRVPLGWCRCLTSLGKPVVCFFSSKDLKNNGFLEAWRFIAVSLGPTVPLS